MDDYHGVRVPDPFRWLEEPSSPETTAWVAEQQALCESWLDAVPDRAAIERRLQRLWDRPRRGLPAKVGGRWFCTENPGSLPHERLTMAETLGGPSRVVFDPNALSEDGRVAPADYVVSPDGTHLAYALSTGGSDWIEWRIHNLDEQRDLDECLRWAKWGGCAWSRDGAGFFYAAFDEPGESEEATAHHKLYYHRLGTPQSEDRLVFARPDQPHWLVSPTVTLDGRYLVIEIVRGTDPNTLILVQSLEQSAQGKGRRFVLVERFEARYRLLGNEGSRLIFLTTLDAPRGRIVSVDLEQPGPRQWQELIAQRDRLLEHAVLTRDHLVGLYLDDCKSAVEIFDRAGHPERMLELPGVGSVQDLSTRQDEPHCLLAFESFTRPRTRYRVDLEDGRCEPLPGEAEGHVESDRYETHQVFFESKDGTRVPMFVVHRPDIPLDGRHPTYLYGYGGFGACETPNLREDVLAWLDMGGIFALPNLRGGGEYGEDWHRAGVGANKQRVFDDFIAAATWLVERGYTRPSRLAIGGGSNGGLLVAACMLQRPELFGAVVCMVGVLDMLRYQHWTIGWAWTGEYGSSDDPEQFETLRAYSPLHNVDEEAAYPPILLTTGDHDDRVVSAHSFKFAAALQDAARDQPERSPILLRVETRAGHGAGKPTAAVVAEQRDRLSFLVATLGGLAPEDES